MIFYFLLISLLESDTRTGFHVYSTNINYHLSSSHLAILISTHASDTTSILILGCLSILFAVLICRSQLWTSINWCQYSVFTMIHYPSPSLYLHPVGPIETFDILVSSPIWPEWCRLLQRNRPRLQPASKIPPMMLNKWRSGFTTTHLHHFNQPSYYPWIYIEYHIPTASGW